MEGSTWSPFSQCLCTCHFLCMALSGLGVNKALAHCPQTPAHIQCRLALEWHLSDLFPYTPWIFTLWLFLLLFYSSCASNKLLTSPLSFLYWPVFKSIWNRVSWRPGLISHFRKHMLPRKDSDPCGGWIDEWMNEYANEQLTFQDPAYPEFYLRNSQLCGY